MSASEKECSGALLGDDDDMEEMSNLLEEMDKSLMDDEAEAQEAAEIQSRITDMWNNVSYNRMVTTTFKYRLSWTWPSTARYLIIISLPTFDKISMLLDIDPKNMITKYFNEILGEGTFGIIPCALGHNGNTFQSYPESHEFDVSAPYIRSFIGIVNPQCIFTIGAFPAEAMRCDMNSDTIFLKRSKGVKIKSIPQLSKAVVSGDMGRTTLGGMGSYRYIMLPSFSKTGKEFKASIMKHVENLETVHKFKFKSSSTSIFDPEYNFSKDNMDEYTDSDGMVYSMLNDSRYDKHNLRVNVHNLSEEEKRTEYMFLTSLQYDHDQNMMRCFFTTPHGISHLMQVRDIPMRFGFTPHVSFSMDPDRPHGGPFAGMAENLQEGDLRPLHAELCNKLRWVFGYKRRDISGDIKLSIKKCHVHGEAQYYDLRKVIICQVTDYALMKPIIQLLERLIRNWPLKNEQIFTPLETYSAEQIFSYTNTFKVCHWYRIKDFNLIPHHYGNNPHLRQIVSTVVMGKDNIPFECIPPDSTIPMGNGKFPHSLPPHTQVSMDIECVGENNHFPDPWKDPIICICNTAWRKENEGVETNGKTHTPVKGYLYVTFNLGVGDSTKTHTTLLNNGESVHYYFTNEKDMLYAYAWWLHFMIPDYFMGHNFKAFDINYIVQRATVLGLTLPPMGKVANEVIRVDKYKMSTRAFGDRTITNIKMTGVCLLDFLEILLRDFKMESNTLDFAGQKILGDTKLVMPYNALRGNWLKNPETFQKVIDYCVVDAQLVDRLINAKMCIGNAMSLSMVTGTVTPAQLWELGMQIKLLSAIAHINMLRPSNYAVMFPTFDSFSNNHNDIIVEKHMIKNGNFEGTGKEDEEAELPRDTVIWSATSTASSSSNSGKGGRKRTSRLDMSCGQGVISSGGEVIGRMEESEYERQMKRRASAAAKMSSSSALSTSSASSSSTTEVKEDYDKILRDIRLNGGENVKKSIIVEETYTGAVVIDAPLGMYFDLPNLCMDFEGLYPSIMMAYNMGGDTIIFESDRLERGLSLEQVHTPPGCTARNPRTGKIELYHFVHKEIWPSVISETEVYLKAARGAAKAKLKEAEQAGDANMKSIYNALQNNFKLIMNSVYGGLGVSKGPIACKPVAKAVTAWGREWIMTMARVVYETVGGIVVGGDTDSIFVNFPGVLINGKLRHRIRNREEGELFGPWLVKTILNPLLPKPMALAYEKMMWYLMTIAKKRYNYIHIELFQEPRIAAKGMETVRRDATKFTRTTLQHMQKALLVMPDQETLKLLYPKPCKANPLTYYTRYKHYIYNEDGLRYQPPASFVAEPTCPEHAEAISRWEAMTPTQKHTHLQQLKLKWREDEKTYFETQKATIKANKEKLIAFVRERADLLVNGKVPLTQCIQSKQRSKENYKNDRQPHLTVIKLKEQRGEEVPQLGERVKFAYRSLPLSPNGKGKLKARKAYECAEDPIQIIKENQPVDWVYYLHNTFVKPVARYMRWVLKDEMIDRIKKRRAAASKRSTSFFIPVRTTLFNQSIDHAPNKVTLSTDEEDIANQEDITLGDITEEVTQFLFSTPNKKSPLYANIETRYAKLITTRKRALPHNNPIFSPIAQYRDKEGEDVRNLFERHQRAGKCSGSSNEADIEDLGKYLDLLSVGYESTYNKCMDTCRNCLGTETVECENIDCDEFLPRLDADVKFTQINKDKELINSLKGKKIKQ